MTDPIPDEAVEAATDGIRDRLRWPSMHWGVEDVHPDAWPHIARAAVEAAAPHIAAGIALRIEREAYGEQCGINEPHPTIDDLIDWAASDRAEATDHAECPHWCDLCGEQSAKTLCEHCNGSGCGPGTALGAYEECEWCAGSRWVHDGCAEKTYAELVAELADVRAGIEALRDEWRAEIRRAEKYRYHAINSPAAVTALDALLRERAR